MTTYDDGTPVQPGDLDAAWERLNDRINDGWGPCTLDPADVRVLLAATRPVKPRPPLPTQLGAVVWVGPLPYFLARDGWFDADGHDPRPDWLAGQDWTLTPPGGATP